MGQRARMSSARGKRGSYTTAPRPPQNVLGLLRAGEEQAAGGAAGGAQAQASPGWTALGWQRGGRIRWGVSPGTLPGPARFPVILRCPPGEGPALSSCPAASTMELCEQPVSQLRQFIWAKSDHVLP